MDAHKKAIASWRNARDDVIPNAKMLALIRLLKEAEAAGDKTIVFSQCKYCYPILHLEV
jgi:hypothetical protein